MSGTAGTSGVLSSIVAPVTVAPVASQSDAFGRARFASPDTIFDSKPLYDALPLQWDDQPVSGAGTSSTHSTARASVTLGVSNVTAGVRVRQTKRRFNYEPGKSQLTMMTMVMGAPTVGITRRAGMFDDANGIFLQQTSTGPAFVVRSSVTGAPVDNAVAQADWSLDTLDGDGPSGIVLDLSKAQILYFDFEWLGVGTVRVGFVIDGEIVYAHRFQTANVGTSVYMSTPNNPLRYELRNSGAGPAATFECICSTVIAEGGQQGNGVVFSTNNEALGVTCAAAGTAYTLLQLRLRSTHFGVTVDVLDMSILGTTSNDAFLWELRLNPVVAGAFAFAGIANSALERSVGVAANTATGGTILASGYAASDQTVPLENIENALRLGATIAGVADVLALTVTPVVGAPLTVVGALTWRELA